MGSTTTSFYQVNTPEAIAVMQSLVRIIGDQLDAENRAYERGWKECGEAMAKYAADMWQAGYEAAEKDMDDAWKPVARAVRANGLPGVRTFDEKRREELETLKPRATDFMGMAVAS